MRAKLFFILSVLVIQQLSAQNYSIQNFRAEDGLITDLIKCVEQDDEGFVWIGTDEGLYRYMVYHLLVMLAQDQVVLLRIF